jgi:dihydrodipicolinate synthase/N-acetylneuraminate lyase
MALWQRMIPSLLCIWRGQYIPKVKAASRLRGFDGGSVRAPLQNLDAAALTELETCLEPLQQD